MPVLPEFAEKSRSFRRFLPLVAGFSGAALLIALFLLLRGRELPGCGGGSGCEAVGASKWSRWGAVPVAGLGAAAYLGLLLASVAAIVSGSKWARWGVGVVSLATLGGIAWFVGLQMFIIGNVCAYCMVDHGVGAAAGGLGVWAVAASGARAKTWAGMVAGAAVGLGALVGGQLVLEPTMYQVTDANALAHRHGENPLGTMPATSTATARAPATQTVVASQPATTAAPARQVALLNKQLVFDPSEYPLLGSARAPAVMVGLFDYTCPHCRRMHPMLLKALERYGDGLAVVEFVVPLNSNCNSSVQVTDSHATFACEYARFALAVWKADAGKFAAYDAWLFEGENPPAVDEARKKAEALVGAEAFAAAIKHEDVEGRLKVGISVFQYLGAGQIPKMVLGDQVVVGEATSQEQLYELLEKHLGVKAVK